MSTALALHQPQTAVATREQMNRDQIDLVKRTIATNWRCSFSSATVRDWTRSRGRFTQSSGGILASAAKSWRLR